MSCSLRPQTATRALSGQRCARAAHARGASGIAAWGLGWGALARMLVQITAGCKLTAAHFCGQRTSCEPCVLGNPYESPTRPSQRTEYASATACTDVAGPFRPPAALAAGALYSVVLVCEFSKLRDESDRCQVRCRCICAGQIASSKRSQARCYACAAIVAASSCGALEGWYAGRALCLTFSPVRPCR
jgi:hypothetical protein